MVVHVLFVWLKTVIKLAVCGDSPTAQQPQTDTMDVCCTAVRGFESVLPDCNPHKLNKPGSLSLIKQNRGLLYDALLGYYASESQQTKFFDA